jgi:N-acetylneuraminic acid mutarotase
MKNAIHRSSIPGGFVFASRRAATTLLNQRVRYGMLLLLASLCLPAHAQTGEWTWMGGSSTESCTIDNSPCGQRGMYGAGTFAPGNIPGGRYSVASWTDKSGHFWLFGGRGYDANDNLGRLNDLWEFNPLTNQWAWMGGSSTVNQHGVYGTLGTPAAGNVPGGREGAVSWTDSSGHFWLFGGLGYDANKVTGNLNDLWEYDPATKKWTWMGGSSTADQPGVYGNKGVPNAKNSLGSHVLAAQWTDSSGHFWLFGGQGYDADGGDGLFNDLWEYDPSTKEWTWMGGSSPAKQPPGMSPAAQPGVYGTKGVPNANNVPGSRIYALSWTDNSGHFWLFGGRGYDANNNLVNLNDLWEFIPSTNPSSIEWAWMGGSNTVPINGDQPGVYGTVGTFASGNIPGGRFGAIGWTGSNGRLWLFGGFCCDAEDGGILNDLWEFNPLTNQWALMGGSSTVPLPEQRLPGVYGTKGVPNAKNVPGSRTFAVSWTDNGGHLWLFGGLIGDPYGNGIYLNDLWKYQPPRAP